MAVLPIGAAAAPAPPAAASRASFGDVMRAHVAPATTPPAPPAGVRLLQGVEQARARLDAVLAEARRGRTFSAGELLALQADAYRAGQTVELASKVVEQGAQSIRQAVNTQV